MIGRTLGRYQILSLLGEGGMGSVYEAIDTHLKRAVALKMMRDDRIADPQAVLRFQREAESLARLRHNNIVTIYDYLEADGRFCLVMELVEGESLQRAIAAGRPMTPVQKLRLLSAVCSALHDAHGKGVVHRDLKPSNILVRPDGSPMIVDFGIAKLMGDDITHTRAQIGTLAYMSPEQFNGKPIDHRTDIFAAGAVLYELLSGVSPFDGETTAVVMRKLILEPTPPLPSNIAGVPPSVHTILDKALSKEPELRYQTAAEMVAALDHAIEEALALAAKSAPTPPTPKPWRPTVFEPVVPKPVVPTPPRPEPSPDPSPRPRPLLGLLGVLALVAVGYGIYAMSHRSQPAEPAAAATVAPGPSPILQGNDAYTRKDYAAAATFYRQGCDNGHGDLNACYSLGNLFYTGQGVGRDLAQAYGHFKVACDGYDGPNGYHIYPACGSLGTMYFVRDQPGDREQAAYYWSLACSSGQVQTACDLLRKNEMKLITTPPAAPSQ